MKRPFVLSLSLCVLAVLAFAFWAGYRAAPYSAYHLSPATTNAVGSEPPVLIADPAVVGRWCNSDNPQWHKVYLDDFDEEQQLFWGKEWNEDEEVFEYDLRYHGNGWFRWNVEGGTLHEYATMDARDVPIHRAYVLHRPAPRHAGPLGMRRNRQAETTEAPDTLVYHDADYRNRIYRFTREQ